MAATPDPDEIFVDMMYSEDSVIKATKKIIHDSKLLIKTLGKTVDDVNRYNKVVEYGTNVWYSALVAGWIATSMWVYLFAFDSIGPVMGEVILFCVLICTIFGLVFVPKMVVIWKDYKVKKMVDGRLLLQVKQLHHSIEEFHKAPKAPVVICLHTCVYNISTQQEATIKAAILMATNISLECASLRDEGCLTTNGVLPQLKKQFKNFKTSVRLLHVAVREQYKLAAPQN